MQPERNRWKHRLASPPIFRTGVPRENAGPAILSLLNQGACRIIRSTSVNAPSGRGFADCLSNQAHLMCGVSGFLIDGKLLARLDDIAWNLRTPTTNVFQISWWKKPELLFSHTSTVVFGATTLRINSCANHRSTQTKESQGLADTKRSHN